MITAFVMKHVYKILQHQFIIGAFFILSLYTPLIAQKDTTITISSEIWTDLNVQYDIDSIHHVKFTHQERYGQQNTSFSTVGLFRFITRMDNAIMYEYTPKRKWKGGIRESFVWRANNRKELFSRVFVSHQGHVKFITFNQTLNVDWFSPLVDSDNPNIVQYDLGRLVYMFEFSKNYQIKTHRISPFFYMHLFQIRQLQQSNNSLYNDIFIDQTRFFLGADYYPFKRLKIGVFGMLEQRYFGRSDDSTLKIRVPTYALSIKYQL